MNYGDLNLKYLREKLNLDFAHFTYTKNMCSCCYGPSDLPSLYWKDRKVIDSDDANYDKINYILFRNACNGSGEVTKNDSIKKYQSIEWKLESKELLINVCNELKKQLGSAGFLVLVPPNDSYCIELLNRSKLIKEELDNYINDRLKTGYKIL